jgi:hypothetical protein
MYYIARHSIDQTMKCVRFSKQIEGVGYETLQEATNVAVNSELPETFILKEVSSVTRLKQPDVIINQMIA